MSSDLHRILMISMDLGDLGAWMPNGLKVGPAAPIKTFARFLAGFLSSDDFLDIPWNSIDCHRICMILMDLSDLGAWVLSPLSFDRLPWGSLCSILAA